MLQLLNNNLKFSFENVHPDANVSINFQRTLRIPDNDKKYNLPPGFGPFPLMQVDSLQRDKVPSKWIEQSGVVFPMYQSEAMWIKFIPFCGDRRSSAYPFAIKISTGKVSALTGKPFGENLEKGDYVTIPKQPWLDGFVVDKGIIKQFVATPLGSGVSVEQQVTGEDIVGGLQIEVIPMKNNVYNKLFPKQKQNSNKLYRGISNLNDHLSLDFCKCFKSMDAERSEISEMSIGAGGSMEQQIYKDQFGLDVWDIENTNKVFVHLVNSMVWRQLTGIEPPTTPFTAKEYSSNGYPWFEYYQDSPSISSTSILSNIKSIKDLPNGKFMMPENEDVNPKIINISPVKDLSIVRDGKF
jgi:hypothetical protein